MLKLSWWCIFIKHLKSDVFYAFIWVKGENREFVCVRSRIREADFKAFSSVSPTGSVSIGLVKAYWETVTPKKETSNLVLQSHKCPVVSQSVPSTWCLFTLNSTCSRAVVNSLCYWQSCQLVIVAFYITQLVLEEVPWNSCLVVMTKRLAFMNAAVLVMQYCFSLKHMQILASVAWFQQHP